MKNLLEGGNTLDSKKEWVNLKVGWLKLFNKEQRTKAMKKYDQSFWNFSKTIKLNNVNIMGVPEEERRTESIFQKTNKKQKKPRFFLMKNISLYTQQAQQTLTE